MDLRNLKGFVASIGVLLVLIGVSGCATATPSPAATPMPVETPVTGRVVIGSLTNSETQILAEAYKIVIEKAFPGVTVEHKTGFATINLVHEGVKAGDLDVYFGYNGGVLQAIMGYELEEIPSDMGELNAILADTLAEDDMVLMPNIGFNNTYVITLRPETAEEYDLQTMSDLVPVSNELVFCAESNYFEEWPGSFPDLLKTYPYEFQETVGMDYGLMFTALGSGDCDVINGASTDPKNLKYGFVFLEDDQLFFPRYDLVPIVSKRSVDSIPGLRDVLDRFSGTIDEETMMKYALEVDINEREPADVAVDLVRDLGIDP